MFDEADLYLDVTTPLGLPFTVLEVHGEEALSTLFDYTVVLETSSEEAVDFDAVVGQHVTLAITMDGGGVRYVDGIVAEWAREHHTLRGVVYVARLRPWLWELTLSEDHRIFQNQTVPAILEAVFRETFGFSDYELRLQGTYPERVFCVQYRETAFAFVCRLMEEEGIFYFFEHQDGLHTLVLADDNSACQPLPNLATAAVLASPDDAPTDTSIRALRVAERVTAGKYGLSDYHFETPSTNLYVNADGDAAGVEVYEYPGRYTETSRGQRLADVRMDAREADRRLLDGDGVCRDFAAGGVFTLEDHPVEALNTDYVLRHLTLEATQDGYRNTFTAAPETLAFRPRRTTPRPRITGPQTAVVVGPDGEEVYTDEYGRIKVQFHWDREGARDENSSCWIRVAQRWAGQRWGQFFLPRIGQEVVVSFLEGDPDRPLVTGAVYNAEQGVPYPLPDEQARSTIKSNSMGEEDGFNELRFDDKEAEEEVYLHAQKTLLVEVRDHRRVVINEEEAGETDPTDALEVHGNRTITIVGEGTKEMHTNEGAFEQAVTKTFLLKVDGDTLTIEAANDLIIKGATVTIESTSGDVTIKSAANLKGTATSNVEMNGVSATVEGSASAELKGGGSATVEGGGAAEVKGAAVKVEGSVVQIN